LGRGRGVLIDESVSSYFQNSVWGFRKGRRKKKARENVSSEATLGRGLVRKIRKATSPGWGGTIRKTRIPETVSYRLKRLEEGSKSEPGGGTDELGGLISSAREEKTGVKRESVCVLFKKEAAQAAEQRKGD